MSAEDIDIEAGLARDHVWTDEENPGGSTEVEALVCALEAAPSAT